MNEIIFIGGIVPECKYQETMEQYGAIPQAAADMLQKSIINGLEENGVKVTVFNCSFLPAGILNFERTEAYTFDGKYGENYNLSYIRNKILAFNSKSNSIIKAVSSYIKANYKEGETVKIFVYPAYFPFMRAIKKLKKTYNINACLAIPDLPQFMGVGAKSNLHHRLSSFYSKAQFEKNLECIDSFVLLTEYMNEQINVYNRPFKVMEGIVPSNYDREAYVNSEIKTIVYSGGINFNYGVGKLLEAIKLVEYKNVKFRFYGNGDAVEALKSAEETDSRIEYMGSVGTQELHKIQQQAFALVNPRDNTIASAKYSFPSKNLEYLMSDRPVIAYMLDGIPKEYKKYTISPKNASAKALAETIDAVLCSNEDELRAFGRQAGDFVREYKNPKSQTKKILELLEAEVN